MKFRPVAVPLVAVDPFFSIWSSADRLTDDHPRHWTGHRQSMLGVLSVDGKPYRFMGKVLPNDAEYFHKGDVLEQTSLEVRPTTTVYTFEHPACRLTVTFVTPLLCDRLEVLSRPASYVFYEITPREEGHRFSVWLDAFCEIAGDLVGQEFVTEERPGDASVGNAEQKVLCESGDEVRIKWGYLHLVHPNARVGKMVDRMKLFGKRPWPDYQVAEQPLPLLIAESEKLADCFILAYDDIKAIEYNHRQIDAYYKKFYGDFDSMVKVAVREADALRAACAAFDKDFTARMEKISPTYAKIGALTYRQAIAAHKVVEIDGKVMFFSKENLSNGCMATLDVTYPSIPLFLVLNPELVRGMMRPLFAFARDKRWNYDFAPHDCGQYPLCNGQKYWAREDDTYDEKGQMPVEECGNAILTVAAAVRADGDRSLAEENRDLLTRWADYLVKFGYDPDNQLCTDDFAGHLAHNCNLSVKAIVALGAFAQLFGEKKYAEIAKEMADRWVVDAKRKNEKGWRLAFDQDDSWSMKYNMVWDRLLGLGLFDPAVAREEQAVYIEKMNRYGTPLDSRKDYTKNDWFLWTTVMADNPIYAEQAFEALARFIGETVDRVPVSDWYMTTDARQVGFQARSVVGGFYINLVERMFLGDK